MFPQTHSHRTRLVAKIALLAVVLLVIGIAGVVISQSEVIALSTQSPPRKPKEDGLPTPWPTVVLPPMTPVPTRSVPPEKPTPSLPIQPQPTPRPSDPYHLIIHADGFPSTRFETQDATAIVIGTVKEVMPPRWSTDEGQRPPNPWEGRHHIFRPVLIEVEQYLKGLKLTFRHWLADISGSG